MTFNSDDERDPFLVDNAQDVFDLTHSQGVVVFGDIGIEDIVVIDVGDVRSILHCSRAEVNRGLRSEGVGLGLARHDLLVVGSRSLLLGFSTLLALDMLDPEVASALLRGLSQSLLDLNWGLFDAWYDGQRQTLGEDACELTGLDLRLLNEFQE